MPRQTSRRWERGEVHAEKNIPTMARIGVVSSLVTVRARLQRDWHEWLVQEQLVATNGSCYRLHETERLPAPTIDRAWSPYLVSRRFCKQELPRICCKETTLVGLRRDLGLGYAIAARRRQRRQSKPSRQGLPNVQLAKQGNGNLEKFPGCRVWREMVSFSTSYGSTFTRVWLTIIGFIADSSCIKLQEGSSAFICLARHVRTLQRQYIKGADPQSGETKQCHGGRIFHARGFNIYILNNVWSLDVQTRPPSWTWLHRLIEISTLTTRPRNERL
jgi:hypothetical protein